MLSQGLRPPLSKIVYGELINSGEDKNDQT